MKSKQDYGEPVAVWEYDSGYIDGPKYRLELFEAHHRRMGRAYYAYRFYQDGVLIFEDHDFGLAPQYSIESEHAAEALLSFLSSCDGNTDAEYFDSYTPEQIEWRDSHAEDLSIVQLEIAERLGIG